MFIHLGQFVLVADKGADFLPLADTQIGRGIEAGTLLDEGMNHLETECFRQFAQLGQRCLELDIAHIGRLHGRDDGVLGCFICFSLHCWIALLEWAKADSTCQCGRSRY